MKNVKFVKKKIKIMDLQAEKINLVQQILLVQKGSLITKIKGILEKEMIVGYTTDGEPLTKEAYNARLARAEQDVLEGRVTSSEDLRKEVESWKK